MSTADHEYYRNELVSYIEATNEATSTSAALTNRINETVTEMEALAEAYTLAYNAALESVQDNMLFGKKPQRSLQQAQAP